MHSALVSSVRIFWNGCRELSDKERVHELKVNCHCIVAYDTNVETDTFSFPHTRSIRRMSFCCMKNMKASLLSEAPPMQKSEVSDGWEEEATTSQSSASMQVFAAVMVFSECSLNNRCHFCRILKIPYQALNLLQICGSTTCPPAVQLLLRRWLGWSRTLLLSACQVLTCKHNS